MINRRQLPNGQIQVTFVLDDARRISVVGDFNGWDPYQNPLVIRPTGLRSTAIVAHDGAVLRFRYLTDAGEFFDDPDADLIEDNGFGSTHSVIRASITVGRPS